MLYLSILFFILALPTRTIELTTSTGEIHSTKFRKLDWLKHCNDRYGAEFHCIDVSFSNGIFVTIESETSQNLDMIYSTEFQIVGLIIGLSEEEQEVYYAKGIACFFFQLEIFDRNKYFSKPFLRNRTI